MEKIKLEYLQKVRDILTTKGLYQDYQKENISDYDSYELSPIHNNILNILPNGIVILTEEVYEGLLDIHESTMVNKREIPFFLLGKETSNNQVLFNKIFIRSNNETQLVDDLTSKQDNIDHLVICKGYSHPSNEMVYEHFSFGDLARNIQFIEENPTFKDKKIEVVSCVITPSKDINFLYYDSQKQNFYRFSKVMVVNKNNMYTRINCYGDSHQKILQPRITCK